MEDFRSLRDIITGMANCTTDEPAAELYSEAAYAEVEKYSEAAATLHMLLHNAEDDCPRWLEIDPITNKPLYSDSVASEGMEMLLHMAGWRARYRDEHFRYIRECDLAEDAGIKPSSISPSHRMGSGRYTRQGEARSRVIGFNSTELNSFLTAKNAAPGLSDASPKFGHKTKSQRDLILKTITEREYDPKALPVREQGKSGVKAEVRDLLAGHELFTSESSFNEAWKRLRAEEKIKEQSTE